MSELKVNKVSPVTGTELTLGDSGDTIDLSTTTVTLPANSVDSDQYVNASIDNEHLADDAVGLAELSATGTPSASNFLRGDNSWQAAGGGAWTLIESVTADDDASLTITGLDTSVYETFVILTSNLVGATADQILWMRLGDSSGIDSGSNDYSYIYAQHRAGSHSLGVNGNTGSSAQINLDWPLGYAAGEGISHTIYLSVAASGQRPRVQFDATSTRQVAANDVRRLYGSGARCANINVTQVQFLASSGNLTSGRMTIYGIKHT